MDKEIITLAHGSGGKDMDELIKKLGFSYRGRWKDTDDDAATLELKDSDATHMVFTTDSFVVDPIFFPGGDIGHLAFCGTVNDILVMGAIPMGLSLGLVIEEGFSISDLHKIIGSIKSLSEKYHIPIVTGDTKVMEKGKVDKIIINTSAVGLTKKPLNEKIIPGDKIILSGGLGEHAVALLSKRFDYTTSIITDSKPLVQEFDAVRHMIKVAKDPTRGGLAAVLNEIAKRHGKGMLIDEKMINVKPEVKNVVSMLGINIYELACEGRFVAIASKENAVEAVKILKGFNHDAAIIGDVTEGNKVIMQTMLGQRILPEPTGRIVPRIC